MMSLTHIAIACVGAAAIPGNSDPVVFGLCAIGSLLPDIDTTKSLPGKILFPIASWLEERGEHRGFTHSYLCTALIAIASFPLWSLYGWHYWIGLPLGHFLSCRADCFTKSGVRLFWPHRGLCVAGLNPNFRLATGSGAEIGIIFAALALSFLFININGGGGLSQIFSQQFMLTERTAIELFQKHGSNQIVKVQIQGRHSSGSSINQEYTVLDVVSGDLIVIDTAGVPYRVGYSTECQIKPTTIKSSLAGAAAIRSREQQIMEADADAWIAQLPPTAYVSGELQIDDGAELRSPQNLQSMPTINAGSTTTLNYARSQDIKPVLSGAWITSGRVLIKEVSESGMDRSR